MSKKEKLLQRARHEFESVRRSMELVPTSYKAAIKTLSKAAADVETGDLKAALKELELAKNQVEAEQSLQRKTLELGDRRSKTSNYTHSERELKLESMLFAFIRNGDFERAMKTYSSLESEVKRNISRNVENCLEIIPPSGLILQPGKGNTIKMVLANNGPIPISLTALRGRSDHGKVTVFRKFTGAMKPESEETITVNMIPDVEGDVVLEIEAEVSVGSRQFKLAKQTSVHVASRPFDMRDVGASLSEAGMKMPRSSTAISDGARDMRMRSGPSDAPSSEYSISDPNPVQGLVHAPRAGTASSMPLVSDPMELVESGPIAVWADHLLQSFERRGEVDLSGIQEVYPDYKMMKGYRNLLLAPLKLEIDSPDVWEAWVVNGGMKADEFTNRCFRLLLRFAGSGMRIEFEHDNSVGSTDKDYFTAALHIAGGYMVLDKEKRRALRTWKFSLSDEGTLGDECTIVKTVRKDQSTQMIFSVFSAGLPDSGVTQTSKRKTRKVRRP